jgi:long-chain alkane monooxygenase
MAQEIRINAFAIFSPTHLTAGLWRHPRDNSIYYNDIEFWNELAQIIERGKFDGLFLADGLSMYRAYGGSPDASIRNGVQFPRLDPLLLVPALAQVTRHLGFGVTSSVSYEPPYLFARRMTTLDHLTKGRAGWNIVTSFGDDGARALGHTKARAHDNRYDLADEYMDIVYKLWEGSWADSAIRKDRESGIFAIPEKIRAIDHEGEFFRVSGRHASEPSPQRTPVLYQAGSSTRGREFAARHAECVFISAPSKRVVRDVVTDVRRRAALHGRNPRDILFFMLLTVIVGNTDEEAHEKLADYRRFTSVEGTLTLFSGWTGIDLSRYAPSDPVTYIENQGMQSTIEGFTIADPDRVWTVGEIAEHGAIGGKGPLLVGSPGRVADEMQGWLEATGADGFNLSYALMPESFADFVDLVVPELQRRGVYKNDYEYGTLREKLFGPGRSRLPAEHPAAAVR